jgi:hypothetical protein
MAMLCPDVFRDEVTVLDASSFRKKEDRSSRGESGEKEGNDVRDLSDGAIDEAELEGWDISFLRPRALDRWLLIEVPDCCEMERSSGADAAAMVASMLSDRDIASYKATDRV